MKQYKIWHPVMNRFVTDECYIRASDGELFSYEADYGGTFSSHEKLEKVNGVLVRWTGCYDKNRTPIYEGDIVKATSDQYENENFVGKVIFDEGCFLTWVNTNDIRGIWGEDDIEVIGNIFENSEQLES